MLLDPKEFKHISHPMVESVYMKSDLTVAGDNNVMVVKFKTASQRATPQEREGILIDFLSNLDLIRDEIEQKTGKFERIDLQGF